MATLYDIDERLRMLEEYSVDIETGEILDNETDFKNVYEEIKMDLQTKIEQTLCFVKNLNADIQALKSEEDKLKKRRQAKENLVNRLKRMVNDHVILQCENDAELNAYKFETPKCRLSYRKSEVVDVYDLDSIPSEYITIKTEKTANKTDIKKAIKDGKEISGATIQTNYNMQIK